MTTDPIIDSIRALRRKIFETMLKLPDLVYGSLTPESVTVEKLFGRYVPLGVQYDITAYLAGSFGEKVTGVTPQPWQPSTYTSDSLVQQLLTNSGKFGAIVAKITTTTETLYKVIEPVKMTAGGLVYSVDQSNVRSINAAPNYPPSYPLQVEATGIYAEYPVQEIGARLVIGKVSYNSTVKVYGAGILLEVWAARDTVLEAEVMGYGFRVKLPKGADRLLVLTDVWSMVADYPVMQTEV